MIEIDYMAVGQKSNTGDAIAFRFTHPETGDNVVGIIDGGFTESGDDLVNHVQNYYKTSYVDLVVCTHPDNDHIMGLFKVFEGLNVGRLLIHRPSKYGYTNDEVKADLVDDLIALAKSKNVIIDDGYYAGTRYFGGAVMIAGPSEAYYKECLANQQVEASAFSQKSDTMPNVRNLSFDPGETLTDDNGGTTARNNSSIILDVQVGDERILFTGDAGAPALEKAMDLLDARGRTASTLDLFDVPHHGSRHNLTKDLVDRILGGQTAYRRGTAIASVGKTAEDHPRAEVANALKRRGYPVHCTRGVSLWWHTDDAPSRWAYNGQSVALDWLDESDESAA